jgi:hypothetical protein
MKTQRWRKFVCIAVLLGGVSFARAHCDTLNGPVVSDARIALAKGDVAPALKWVAVEHEPAIRQAFARTLVVRKQSAEAAELADQFFFETLVRLHRAGEGEPYTGLTAESPAPGVAAAEAALAKETVAPLTDEIQKHARVSLEENLHRVLAARRHADDSVAAGREYVAAYVAFVHAAERLFAAAGGEPSDPAPAHAH